MNTVDITPSPRVLRMLGQIDFAPWQCLAELIDNSIDAFIDQTKAGLPPVEPLIRVQLPSEHELRQGTGRIVIADNARGMSIDSMAQAVRAGYSGNDPVEKMGLFGMGFNISTARLGRRTEVWSTTSDADHWVGLVIDFEELERTKAFHAPVQTRPKTASELERPTHGTQIVISRLEADRTRALTRGNGKRRTRDKLGKIYGRVMSRLGISILYDSDSVNPWRHCVWDEKRYVETQAFGRVPAIRHIDEALPPRQFCTTCWIWLGQQDETCPSCGHANNVITRERRLRGWLGIQRYFDKNHFGIDLIRNGRVIQELDKTLFSFVDESGDPLLEYPIDATHWGGRIVGELEIDFVRVSHQKDSFDKLDPEWRHVVEIVRGTSPMQPRIAERMGMQKNDSPLARLFAGYRKGTAGLKDLVPGTSKGIGLNTGPVIEYKEKFYAGDPAYQSDDKWYELVLQAEKAKRGESAGADEAAGDFPLGLTGGGYSQPDAGEAPGQGVSEPKPEPAPTSPQPEHDKELSRTYEVPDLPGSPAIRVDAYRHYQDIEGKPFVVHPQSYSFKFDYNIRARFFEESLDTPVDCLLIDLAQHFLAVSAQSVRTYPVSKIVRSLRERYFPEDATSLSTSAESASSILAELRRHYDDLLPTVSPIELEKIDSGQLQHIRQQALKAESASTAEANNIIVQGKFARYVTTAHLADLARMWPGILLDGHFLGIPYMTLGPEFRDEALGEVIDCLTDVIWLSEDGGSSLSKDAAWRLRYARALASLRLLQSWRV